MSGKSVRFATGLVVCALTLAPVAHAEPGPGSGETFFVDYMTRVFAPPATEAAARALLPLAQQVCAAKTSGQTDLQAAGIVLSGGGLETLGVPVGNGQDEQTALEVVNASTLSYCPQYNPTIGQPVDPNVSNIPVE